MRSQVVQPSLLRNAGEANRVKALRKITDPHIKSFNYAMDQGLRVLPKFIEPVKFTPSSEPGDEEKIWIYVKTLDVYKPKYCTTPQEETKDLFPKECLQASASYLGDIYCSLGIQIDGIDEERRSQRVGSIPIMVGSKKCNLDGKSPEELVQVGEEEYEAGGYFIVNGSEKLLRQTIVPRVNHPICVRRDRNKSRGPNFSDLSLSVRCQRQDLSTQTFHMHFLKSGGVLYRFNHKKAEYFVPVGLLLRSLLPSGSTYKEIIDLMIGDSESHTMMECAHAVTVDLQDKDSSFRKRDAENNISARVSKNAAVCYLGRNFRPLLDLDERVVGDLEAGHTLLRCFVCPHLSVPWHELPDPELDVAKADFLIHLCRKLVLTCDDEIEEDNPDALSHLQVLLPGNLYLMQLKERFESLLRSIADMTRMRVRSMRMKNTYDPSNIAEIVRNAVQTVLSRPHIGERLVYLIATGNVRAMDNLDLSSVAGLSVMAERINYLRFLSHFRAVHRGSFYAQMRSTKVRKLLPEAWGFICPVHTPDGDPCGILNHLAYECRITQGNVGDHEEIMGFIRQICLGHSGSNTRLGDVELKEVNGNDRSKISYGKSIPLMLDGRVVCYVGELNAPIIANELRYSKTTKKSPMPQSAEVVLVPAPRKGRGFMQGIYIYTSGGRIVRPVHWLQKKRKDKNGDVKNNKVLEYIGTFEQVFLRVRLFQKDQEHSASPVVSKRPTHQEFSSTAFLSDIAALIPFPDMNQGPRNMFQCQMAKQSMGTPCHVFSKRFEAKTYRLTCPQAPITRNFCMQDPLGLDVFGNGMNAIVAVISYTGNDMEDALILNQGSLDRGFAHGTVYETKTIDLRGTSEGRESKLKKVSKDDAEYKTIDEDGLPHVGGRISTGDRLYGTCSQHARKGGPAFYVKHKSVETHTVDSVVISDHSAFKSGISSSDSIRNAQIRTRVSRTPIVGDKFASRAGQKGTVAAKWPMEDMPFSASGMTPDILFNPNGFPSRMTIGMMVESIAGKAGALHGRFQDSTPFRYDEKHRAVEYFTSQLTNAGYSYYGSETLYSGYTGEPFEVEIFMGVVHYQRLRHMVSDKFQVRSIGKVNPMFRQPIKGRKRGGAIRFGEMERDGVLAHGASFIIRDRLGTASDTHMMHVCAKCSSLVSPIAALKSNKNQALHRGEVYCLHCEKSDYIRKVTVPYSFKYLVSELVAMNIRTELKLTAS